MSRPPAFQFYASDFLAGTTLMTNEEVGIYVRALCHQWEAGGLSDLHLERLGLGLGFSGFPQIKAKFALDEHDGLWKNPRLECVRVEQVEYRRKQAENGAKGGRPKGLANPSLTQRLSETEPKKSPPTPTPTPTPNLNLNVIDSPLIDSPKPTKKPAGEHRQMLDAWCQAYEEAHGSKFVVTSRDAKAAKELLASGVKPDDVASLAKAAWANKGKDSWNCQNRTATLYDFADAFMKIKQEVSKSGGTSSAPVGGEFCEGWWNKDPKHMTSKEISAYVDR